MKNPRNGHDILTWLKENGDFLHASFSVSRIGIFGSWARDQFSPTSDIDVLVTFSEPTFDHYMDLKFLLEETFNRPVDLIMEAALKPRLRSHILSEVQYAA